MAFEKIETVKGPSKQLLASISYRRFGKKLGGQPRLVIGIPKGIVGDCKLKDGMQFALTLGTGSDLGKLRIAGVDAGGAGAKMLKGSVGFHFGFVPMLGTDAADKEFVEAKLLPGKDPVFELIAPPWFKADSPAKKPAK